MDYFDNWFNVCSVEVYNCKIEPNAYLHGANLTKPNINSTRFLNVNLTGTTMPFSKTKKTRAN